MIQRSQSEPEACVCEWRQQSDILFSQRSSEDDGAVSHPEVKHTEQATFSCTEQYFLKINWVNVGIVVLFFAQKVSTHAGGNMQTEEM